MNDHFESELTGQWNGYSKLISFLAAISVVLSLVFWILQIIAIIYAKIHFHKIKNIDRSLLNRPGVTILKPIKTIDSNELGSLKTNLETFFRLSYTNYEIIFCIPSKEDLSISIIRKLIQANPNVKAKLLIGFQDVGVNPKICNMQKGYTAANPSNELIWICDAGIRVEKDVLTEMVSLITSNEKIGLVHQLPFTYTLSSNSGLGNLMETIYFGTQHGRVQICAHVANQVCITGMSNLIRKSALEKSCGGLIGLGKYLAEDYFMTKKMEASGYQFRLSSFPAQQNQSHVTIKSFFNRMSRWTKLRIKMLPGITCIEPFSEVFLSSILTSMAINWWFPEIPRLLFFFSNIFCWFWADLMLISAINGKIPNAPFSNLLLCWLIRENSTIYILLSALFNSEIDWMGKTHRVDFGGETHELSS
jgi:ceramide glucosyltransferase